MPSINLSPSIGVMSAAEHELASFLRAATDIVGDAGLPRASDLWIETMESLDWPEDGLDKFFRRVTIRAAAKLTELSSIRMGLPVRTYAPSL